MEEKNLEFRSKEEERLFMRIVSDLTETVKQNMKEICVKLNLHLETKNAWIYELKRGTDFVTEINLAKMILNMITLVVKDPKKPYLIVDPIVTDKYTPKEFEKKRKRILEEYMEMAVIPLTAGQTGWQKQFKKFAGKDIKWLE